MGGRGRGERALINSASIIPHCEVWIKIERWKRTEEEGRKDKRDDRRKEEMKLVLTPGNQDGYIRVKGARNQNRKKQRV